MYQGCEQVDPGAKVHRGGWGQEGGEEGRQGEGRNREGGGGDQRVSQGTV